MPRHPTPTKLLELQKGKLYDEQRDRGKLEPKPIREINPRCPVRFSKAEKKEWKYYADILKNYGLFIIANAPMLDMLAKNSVQYKECAENVAKEGIIVKGPMGNPMYNLNWNAVNKLEDKILRLLADLGMSSSGLAKIGSLMLKKKKEKEEFFED